jgi:hypothetical protein
MSEEGKFWFGIASLITSAFVAIVIACVVNALH